MDNLDALIQRELPRYKTNAGHGHIWPRPDGSVARCGGRLLCSKCRCDDVALDVAKEAVARVAR